MKLKELQKILDARPAATSNTYLISILFISSILLGFIFTVLAFGLLLEVIFEFKIFLNWIAEKLNLSLEENQRKSFAVILGLLSLILATIYFIAAIICKMLLKRNHFILEMEDWISRNIQEIKLAKPANKSKNKIF